MSVKYILTGLIIFLHFLNGFAQNGDSVLRGNKESDFKISGYLDAYWAYYTDSSGTGAYQKFPTISPRSNQFGLNTALVNFEYSGEKLRGLVSLHFGDIAKSAWSPSYNNIMEAHAGFRIAKKLWLDAGFFRTHFGTEGLLPKENLLSSVSVNTFYEPYFEAGARLNYVPDDKWAVTLYVLNGYNIFEDNNNKKSFGMLLSYTAGDKWNAGYSNYIGDDSPQNDSVAHLRFHQNLFFNAQLKKLKIQFGLDYCLQQRADIEYKNIGASMQSGVLGFKYQLRKKFAVATRGEFFYDPQGFMSAVILDNEYKMTGYKLWGITAGAEYKPTENSYIRIEARRLQMNKAEEIFFQNGKNTSRRSELMCNIGFSF